MPCPQHVSPPTSASRASLCVSVVPARKLARPVLLTLLFCAFLPLIALAQNNDAATMEEVSEVLTERARRYDWAAEAPHIERALGNIWTRYNWTSESDASSLAMAKEVSAIPPWQPLQRIEVLSRRIADRYDLTEDKAHQLRNRVFMEVSRIFAKNAGTIMQHMSEAIETRQQARPFTSEQIARWMKEAEQASEDGLAMVAELIETLKGMVPAEKRALLERDIRAFDKRQKQVDQLVERWIEGKWQPSDWGLQDDPVHARMLAARRGDPLLRKASAEEPSLPTRWVAHDPDTWIAYLRHVMRRFGLDKGQTATGLSIHAEMLERAQDYMTTRKQRLDGVPTGERAAHELYGPIRTLFGELEERLDAIPTTTQRESPKP